LEPDAEEKANRGLEKRELEPFYEYPAAIGAVPPLRRNRIIRTE
jgi:hypothetical protein